MTTEEFFSDLIISEAEIENAQIYLFSKGVEKHNIIKEYLKAWKKGKQKIYYSAVATTYRYDKRIRQVLFKYISYLEEFYRGIILDNYSDDLKSDFLIDKIKIKLSLHSDMNFNDVLEDLGFEDLINQMQKLPKSIVQSCNFNVKNLAKNLYAVKVLRNAVMHNKFLVLYKRFNYCYFENGVKDASLKSNILNLIRFLPKNVGDSLKDEINNCKKRNGTEKIVKWNLPTQIVVSL